MEPEGADQIERVVKEARELIKMMESTSVRRVNLEAGSYKIEIERAFAEGGGALALALPGSASAAGDAGPARGADKHHRVLAPMVGTYYHSASPGSKPFVEPGARVQRGDPVGIIEAMKVMNEVTSDVAGVVVELLVQNGHPVQYEQPLLVIDTASA